MRVLVTGAAGFIGSHVAEALADAGHEVRWLDSLTSAVHDGEPPYIPNGSSFLRADIRDSAAVTDALDGVDAVFHLAAMVGLGVSLADLPLYSDVNVTGTAVLLDAMGRQGVGRLVLSSSMVVYGEGAYSCREGACPASAAGPVRPLPRDVADLEAGVFDPRCPSCGRELSVSRVPEDATLDPRNAYATSKVAQEHLAANWARLTGGSCVALRYHNVYGPRMPRDTPYSGVAAIFRSALENGESPRVFEDGGQMRDFVHVRDVAACNVRALSACGSWVPPGTLRAYNVASGTPRSVGEMASALAEAFGGSVQPKVTGEYRLGDVRHIVASPKAAACDLGFHATVDFTDGVAEFARASLRAPTPSSLRAPTPSSLRAPTPSSG
ncbi:MAG: NAD-dependent epimerase/dehydratase family protein [Nocardiopsaceae bacterium]|nr:NAD-dependent epimerase/dehydratase family protein [Nocardiopsaceae bacterium]